MIDATKGEQVDPKPSQSEASTRADQAQPAKIEKSLSNFEDWVGRTKYEMAEKVEEQVWNWLWWRILAPAALILAFVGYVGPSLTLDYVTRHIESDLTKETDVLRHRIEDQLADMDVRTADLKSQATTAQNELAELKNLANAVQEITPQYEALKAQVHEDRSKVNNLENDLRAKVAEASQSSDQLRQMSSQFQQISQRVGDLNTNVLGAQQFALGTQLSVTNLSQALTSTDPDSTLITGSSSPTFSGNVSLSGQHFGNSKGKAFFQVTQGAAPFLPTTGTTLPVLAQIDDASIASWQDTKITLHLSNTEVQRASASQ